MIKRYFIASLAMFFICSTILKGQSSGNISERCKQVIDSTYTALIKKYKVVGASIAIVDKGQIVYSNGYGYADREKKILAGNKTIYRIGSCSKSFTSLSILQLQEKGLLDINHSVKEYLPELNINSQFNDHNDIFIKDMLCHVSGLPCDISNGFFCDSPPNIGWEIQALNKETTILPKRYKHAYSNVAFGLLGEVIARKSYGSYGDYLQQHVFLPLKMESSFVKYEAKWDEDFSKAYVNNKKIKEPLIRDAAAGLVHSNVLDMSNYIMMYLNRGAFDGTNILTPDHIAEMEKNQLSDVYLSNGESWGFGLYSKKLYSKQNNDSVPVTLIGHGGDTYAFHADFAYIPELNVGAVILTNTDNGARMNSASRLLKIYMKQAFQKTLNLNFVDSVAIAECKKNDVKCLDDEKLGTYNLNHFLIEVNNADQFKFKQGPATLLCTRKKGDSASYLVKIRIFGFIPIHFQGPELKFVKKDGDVFIKTYNIHNKEEEYIGAKNKTNINPNTWQNALGNYVISGDQFSCTNCPYMNSSGLKMQLKIKNNCLVLQTKGKTSDMNNVSYLNILSDKLAVSGGINRGDGEAVHILKNGNIHYSGFEFKKLP
ncbi:MAG: serine hydrolase domain-containing protein [Bacteroidota bacterium]